MNIEDTFINGLKIIHLEKFMDERGSFLKVFNFETYRELGLETEYLESYFSISAKNVIRGMHFQVPPYEHTKLVFCNYGNVLDVILDLRRNSATFKKYFSIHLDTERPKLLYIPKGCAHGFLSLTDCSIVTYFQTSVHKALYDRGVKYNSFGMDWGIKDPIVSKRDDLFVGIDRFNSPF